MVALRLQHWCVIASLSAVLLCTGRTAAQDQETEPPGEYRTAITEALAHFDASSWQAAYDAFGRAHSLKPNARTLRGMGMSAYNLDQFARARRHLEAALVAVKDALTASQREHVRQLLDKTRLRTGRYALSTQPGDAEIWLDGRSTLERIVIVDAGHHELLVDAEGYTAGKWPLDVRGGEDERMDLSLERESPTAAPLPVAPTQHPEAPAPELEPDQSSSTNVAAIVVLSASGAALGGAIVTGLLELSAETDLDELCPGRICAPQDEPRANEISSDIETLQLTTDVLLVAGLVGAGIGTWLLFDSEDDPETDTATIQPSVTCGTRGCFAAVSSAF